MTLRPPASESEPARDDSWSPRDSAALYQTASWGAGFFHVGENGHVAVSAGGDDDARIDLHSLVLDLQRRGLRTPMLLRFTDILARRVAERGTATPPP